MPVFFQTRRGRFPSRCVNPSFLLIITDRRGRRHCAWAESGQVAVTRRDSSRCLMSNTAEHGEGRRRAESKGTREVTVDRRVRACVREGARARACPPSKFDIPSGLQKDSRCVAAMEPRRCAGPVLIGVYLWTTFCCKGGSSDAQQKSAFIVTCLSVCLSVWRFLFWDLLLKKTCRSINSEWQFNVTLNSSPPFFMLNFQMVPFLLV